MSMYDDVDEYIGVRRVTGLAVSHDFSRAVIVIAALDDSRTEYRTSLWEIGVDGGSQARRLTHGEWVRAHRCSPRRAICCSLADRARTIRPGCGYCLPRAVRRECSRLGPPV